MKTTYETKPGSKQYKLEEFGFGLELEISSGTWGKTWTVIARKDGSVVYSQSFDDDQTTAEMEYKKVFDGITSQLAKVEQCAN